MDNAQKLNYSHFNRTYTIVRRIVIVKLKLKLLL
jgi:hypothetical protein